jgi:formate hydrogenlyase subunit 4
MTAVSFVAAAVQLAGVGVAPLLPGLVQMLKARLQGRRGPSPWQPYRELVRLWGKSQVSPRGASVVYAATPPLVAASILAASLLLPIGGAGPDWPVGHDALVLVGLLVLARFAIALSAWDTGSGFSLMGAARDLTVAVSAEVLLLLCLLLAVLPAGGTDLRLMSDAASGSAIWSTPAHWCALGAFALVVLAETGRQPIDNPDTHLELTMIHEGPLLEYAGRDLAYLQWASAARHWIVLVLAADLFLPHGGGFWIGLAWLAGWVLAGCAGLALTESVVAKARLLRVPVLLGLGSLIATLGLASWQVLGAR